MPETTKKLIASVSGQAASKLTVAELQHLLKRCESTDHVEIGAGDLHVYRYHPADLDHNKKQVQTEPQALENSSSFDNDACDLCGEIGIFHDCKGVFS